MSKSDVYALLGVAYFHLDAYDDAEKALLRSYEIDKKLDDYDRLSSTLNSLASVFVAAGKPDEAEKYLKEAIAANSLTNDLSRRAVLYGTTSELFRNLGPGALHDSTSQQETSETISRYNAIYQKDILLKAIDASERRNRDILMLGIVLCVIIGVSIPVTLRRHRRKMKSYKQDITSLQEQCDTISSQYQKAVSKTTQMHDGLTDYDRAFIANLTNVIYVLTEQGTCNIDTIVSQLQINPTTLQRRLAQTLAVTPKTFILQARMQKAMYLLQNYRDISIADVAYKCGYAQLPNFTRAFTRYYNITPTEAKK